MARFLPPPLDPSSIAPPSRTDNGTDYGSSEFTDSKSTANPSVRFARDISSTLKPSRDNTLASIVTDRTEDRSIPDESRLDSSLPDKSKGQTSDLTSVPPSSMPNTSRQQSSIPDSTVGQPGFDTFNSKADTQLSELPFSKTEITVDTMDSKPLKGIMKKPGNPRTNKSTRITWNPSTNRTSNKTGTTRRRRSRRGKDSRRTGGSSRRTGGSSRRTGGSSRQTETSSRQTRGSSRRARRSSCRIGGSRSSRRTTKSSRLSRDAGSTSRPTTDTPKIGKWKKPIDSTRYSPTDIRRVLGKSEAWLSTTNADDWTKDRLTKDISYLRDRFEEGDADGWSRRSSRRWKSGISNLSDKLSDISNTDGQGAEWTKIASSVFSRDIKKQREPFDPQYSFDQSVSALARTGRYGGARQRTMKSVEKAMSENSQDWSSPENRGLLSELSSLATEATSRDYSTKKTSRSARKGARYLRRLGSELSATVADKDEK